MNEIEGEEGNRKAFVAELERQHVQRVEQAFFDRALELEAERRAALMDAAIKRELAAAFAGDRPAYPAVVQFREGKWQAEFAPEDQARLYL